MSPGPRLLLPAPFGIAVGLALAASVAEAEPARPWAVEAELRWAVGLERDAAAPTTSAVQLPALVLTTSRGFGALLVHARARLMVPLGYGQEAVGAGIGLGSPIGASAVTGFGRVEAGLSYAFHGASVPELGGADATVYWGPYGRAEFGLRGPIRAGRADGAAPRATLEWTLAAGASVVAARYLAPLSGRGNRLEPDAGGGLRVGF